MENEKQQMDRFLMEEIFRQWRPDEQRAGKLVQRRSAVWHYSAALSNTKAVAWGGIPHQTGTMTVHDIGPEFIDTVNVVYFQKERVLTHILGSVSAFHNVWQYGWGWNCEHWARLVTTGEPKSYQINNAFFGVLNLFGFCFRSEAIPQLLGQVSLLDQRPSVLPVLT
jgi:hypothetical protein